MQDVPLSAFISEESNAVAKVSDQKTVRANSVSREEKDRNKIISEFLDEGLLLSRLAVESIEDSKCSPKKIVEMAKSKNVYFVTKEFVEEFTQKESEKPEYSFVVRKGTPALASRVDSELVIDKDKDITGKSTSEGTIENFIELFKDRYKKLREILMHRVSFRDVVDIENLKRYEGSETKIIGMIRAMRESQKGNLILELEDTTGVVVAVWPVDSASRKINLVNDEVIGVIGTLRGDLFLAKEVVEPDIPTISKEKPEVDENISIAFLSDIHVGSLLFMEREFQKFLNWLNTESGNQRDVAEGIKYIAIAGDLVDGIGIYPAQESELSIPDIYKQYNYISKMLEQIPSYIEIIIAAGNHDAVRRCEPQPSLIDMMEPVAELSNVHLVGNPASFTTHGYETLMYHGTSMDALISSISTLSYGAPETAQIEYLKKRHLSPIYGNREQTAPEEKDLMAIDSVPDIFHCGHVHKNGYADYRGVKIINSGTWQAQTDFQQQQGHIPTPCKVPILNLSSMNLKVVSFSNG
jgi:DNA polymerase II small subunit